MEYPIANFLQQTLEKNRRGNQEWTIQRHWQHWAHKTNNEDKQNTTQKTKMMSNMDLVKNPGVPTGVRGG